MNPYYAEFHCLSVAFALWGNRCQSVALTDADGTMVECKNPLFVLHPDSWWHGNGLDAIILAGPDPEGIARRLSRCAEAIHIAHIRVNKPARCDEGIWQIRRANDAKPYHVLTGLLKKFDQTAGRCKSRIRYLLAKMDYFDGTPWPAGEAAIAKWEGRNAQSGRGEMRLVRVRELAFYSPGPSARLRKTGPRVVAFSGCSSFIGRARDGGPIFIVTTFKWMTNRECQIMSGVGKSPTRRIEHVIDALELNAISQACESDKDGVEPPTIYRHRLIHRAPR